MCFSNLPVHLLLLTRGFMKNLVRLHIFHIIRENIYCFYGGEWAVPQRMETQQTEKIFSKSCMMSEPISWSLVVWLLIFDCLVFWAFPTFFSMHKQVAQCHRSSSSNSGKLRDFSIGMGWWFILSSHKTIMQLPLFQNQQPRQLVSIGLEKTGSTTATTGSGAFLHPPQKLCRWTYCKMLTEHCRVHRGRDEKSADLWVPVQFLASVSQACSLTRSPTGPVFLSHGSCIPYSSMVSLRMWRLFLNYFVASPKFGQKCSEKLLPWRADRLKDRNREGGEVDCFFSSWLTVYSFPWQRGRSVCVFRVEIYMYILWFRCFSH